MSKNFITRLFTSSKTEPAFLSDSRLCELNVDINGVEPSDLYAPPHILVIPVFLELIYAINFSYSPAFD